MHLIMCLFRPTGSHAARRERASAIEYSVMAAVLMMGAAFALRFVLDRLDASLALLPF